MSDDRITYIERGQRLLDNQKKNAGATLSIIGIGEHEVRPTNWLIRGALERDAITVVFGDPKAGKSFVGLSMAASVATGTDWYGNKAEQAPVLILAGEGLNGLAKRRAAWEIRGGLTLKGAPLYVSERPANLTDELGLAEVRGAIDEIERIHGRPPGLLEVDTVARNFGGGDENSTQDMGLFIAALDSLRRHAQGAAILAIHHSGHGDKSRGRGSTALRAAADAEYRVYREDSTVRLEASFMKDAQPPEPLAFELRTVELGIVDSEGEQVTSAVLDRVDYEPPAAPRASRRSPHQEAALAALQRVTEEHRANVEASGRDPAAARVSLDDWSQACRSDGMNRQRFNQAKDALLSRNAVRVAHGFVSIP